MIVVRRDRNRLFALVRTNLTAWRLLRIFRVRSFRYLDFFSRYIFSRVIERCLKIENVCQSVVPIVSNVATESNNALHGEGRNIIVAAET